MPVRLEYLGVEVCLSVHLRDVFVLNQGLRPKEGHQPADPGALHSGLEKSKALHFAHSLSCKFYSA